jgi:ketopantoate reductase
MDPKSSTSAKLDWDNGNQTEVEGLIYNVLKNGEKLELKMVTYKKVSEKLKRQSKV